MTRPRFTTNLILVRNFILLFFSYELRKSIEKISKNKKIITDRPTTTDKINQILC